VITQLSDDQELESALAADLAVIYKHSPICGASRAALFEVKLFVEQHPEVPVYMIDVVNRRPLSQRVADLLKVRHESPQVIIVRDGRALWDTSHFEIQAKALSERIAEAP
jgi:bacillithiol system protein YtxJ